MNKTFNKKRQIAYLIVSVLGIILLILGTARVVKQNRYYKKGDKVVAVVENILDYPDANSETYEKDLEHYNNLLKEYRKLGVIKDTTRVAIIVNYTHNGENITTELGYFSQSYKIAQSVNIFVNKNDSRDFIVEGRDQFGITVAFVLGAVLFLFGINLIIISNHNKKCDSRLKENGEVLETEVLYVDINERKESFGRHPNIFTCVYKNPDTNEESYFTSDSVYSKNVGTEYIGRKVNVYIDPKDKKNYYVDIEKFEKE